MRITVYGVVWMVNVFLSRTSTLTLSLVVVPSVAILALKMIAKNTVVIALGVRLYSTVFRRKILALAALLLKRPSVPMNKPMVLVLTAIPRASAWRQV